MKTKTSHTPTPWEFSDGSIWGVSAFGARVRLVNMQRHSPMNGINLEANAQFVIRACNSHEELLQAVEFARGLIVDMQAGYHERKGGEVSAVIQMLNEAIAKAEGK